MCILATCSEHVVVVLIKHSRLLNCTIQLVGKMICDHIMPSVVIQWVLYLLPQVDVHVILDTPDVLFISGMPTHTSLVARVFVFIQFVKLMAIEQLHSYSQKQLLMVYPFKQCQVSAGIHTSHLDHLSVV